MDNSKYLTLINQVATSAVIDLILKYNKAEYNAITNRPLPEGTDVMATVMQQLGYMPLIKKIEDAILSEVAKETVAHAKKLGQHEMAARYLLEVACAR